MLEGVLVVQSLVEVARDAAQAVVASRVCSPGAERLSVALGVSRTLGDWLAQRELGEPESIRRFLHPKLSELSRPDAMADREAAATRIATAIRARERITVFGDYDCDGMTAAAILTQMLRALGGEVQALLASRFDGGYGVSAAAARRILDTSPGLLITCDCGSSDHETLDALRARGLDVIVIDHHLVPAQPLPAVAFLNPHRAECGFQYKGLASCGLALSVGAAVRTALGKELDLRSWLDLVAIGTIADVAPLDGDNRALVRAGLTALAAARRPGIRVLLEHAKLEGLARLSAEDVAFRLAPRLNAPGRLGSPEPALELLMETDLDRARALGARLEQATLERRAQQDRILLEATEEIAREGYDDAPALVLGREGWNHGIVGIVAGRLADRYARPVVVIGFEGGRGRGSVRGPAGSRLHDALVTASESLVRFGGHQAAAGVELELENLAAFREAFVAAFGRGHQVSRLPAAEQSAPAVWLFPGDPPEKVLAELHWLEPCGPGNPSPELILEARVVSAREVTGGHLKLELELDGGRRIGAFGIELGAHAGRLATRVVVQGRLRPDTYRGGDAVELKLSRIVEGTA